MLYILSLLVITLLAAPVLLYLWLVWLDHQHRKRITLASDPSVHMQGPSIFKSLDDALRRKKHQFATMSEDVEQYGKVHLGHFFLKPMIQIADADEAKNLFLNTKLYEKGKVLGSKFLDRFWGTNVGNSNGDDWKRQRMVMNPAFYKLDPFIASFSSKSLEAVESWKKNNSMPHDIHDYMQKMTLDILGLCAFNHDFGYMKQAGEASEASKTESKSLEAYKHIVANMLNPLHFLLPLTQSLPIEMNKKLHKSLDVFDSLIFQVIEESKKKLEDPQYVPSSLLDMMVQSTLDENSEQKMTTKELRDNMGVFFLAGHETTASSLCFDMYLLAKYPSVQEKLYQEINAEFPTASTELTMEKISKCEYLTNTIKESMRMYPPAVGISGRALTKDAIVAGYKIPKDVELRVAIYPIHFDEKHWKQPHEFRPERFEAEESKGRHQFAYIPFGAGSRVCIGNSFSLLEQKVFLIRLLQNFKVELPYPEFTITVDPKVGVMTPTHDFKLKLTPR